MIKRKTQLKIDNDCYYRIPWFEDYVISIGGVIRLFASPEIIIERISTKTGPVVPLSNSKYTILIHVDRLMMNIFVGKLGYKIIHMDSDMNNCHIKNLKYDIPLEDIETKCFSGKQFKDIPGFSRYCISEDAIIFNNLRRQFMRIGYDLQQYQNLHLINDEGKDVHTKSHILLMITHGPEKPDPKMVCNHKDSIEYHNVLSNLEWVYQYDNIYESYKIGDQHYEMRRTKKDVHKICELILQGKSNKEIIEVMKIPDGQYHNYWVGIQDIRKKNTWKHISDNYF